MPEPDFASGFAPFAPLSAVVAVGVDALASLFADALGVPGAPLTASPLGCVVVAVDSAFLAELFSCAIATDALAANATATAVVSILFMHLSLIE
jgi:hypothetical protein